MKKIYLDYSATTPVKEDVVKEMLPYYTEIFGNPSSLYSTGLEAKEGLEKARKQVAELINATPNEIRFTSCGTEADNWVIEGVADALKKKGNHIITTKIEHHAVLHTCEYLEKQGYEITYLDVDSEGFVSADDLEKAIKDNTILISIMMVNNEIGTVEPIKELAAIAKSHKVLFHTDAVQALGNIPIDVKDLDVDFLSMSAHKIYGPKGVGALYIRRGSRISNFMHGGAQESKKRAGTENMAGIIGFGKAAELSRLNLESHIAHCSSLRNRLWERIEKDIPNCQINGSLSNRHPGNLNVSFDYIEGEAILLMLDANGICVSTGSACSSKSLAPSHVLEAIDVPIVKMNGTIRFTVGDFTTAEDIEHVADILKIITERLREMSPVTGKEGW